MQPRRLFVEPLESRIVLNGIGLGTESQGPDWDHVIVMLNERAANPGAVAERVLGPLGGRVGHVYQHALKGFSAQLPAAAVERLGAHFMVRGLESNLVMHTHEQTVPTGVRRIGTLQNSTANIGGGDEIDVGIAILDTGIDIKHSDLNVEGGIHYWTRYISTGPPRNRGLQSGVDDNYDDDNGHGTHVAGIAAAKDNGSGVVGVAPGARLYAVKVMNSDGEGYMSDIIAGVDWVTDNAEDIQVANMSLGATGQSTALRTAIQSSVGAGVVYVVSAGNGWRDILGDNQVFGSDDNTIPAAFPEVATISAFADSDGEPGGESDATSWGQYGKDDGWWHPSNFSNCDDEGNSWYLEPGNNPVDSPGLGIDLVMPGVDIYSTYLNGGYATASGTSMAAPHAAGLAALYIAENPRPEDADADWVYDVRQALIDQGKAWDDSDYGLTHTWGPDKHEENLGWAGDPDTAAALTVSITEPEDGKPLDGTVTIRAVADSSDPDVSINQVEFFVGEQNLGIDDDGSDGWSIQWDSNTVVNGDYSLTAEAIAGDQTATHTISVTVANDYESPTVEITSPADEDLVSGTVDITATATADWRAGVAQVEFFVGDQSLGIDDDGSDGWSIQWDSNTVVNGDYSLTAEATAGDQTATHTINVTVANEYESPTVEITSPADEDLVSGTVDITAHATADWRAGVAQVEFFVGDQSLGIDDDGSNGWSIQWDTTGLVNDATYVLTAVVTDGEGKQTTSDLVSVTVDNTEPEVKTMTVKLEGEVDDVNRNMWEAIATVIVTDASGFVTGATVSGQWDGGAIVTEYTDSDGVATFYSGNLRKNRVPSITFTLENVVAEGYDPWEPDNPSEYTIELLRDDINSDSAWRSLEDELLSPVDPSAYVSAVDQLMTTAW